MERELGDVIRNRVRGQVMDALYRENALEVPRPWLTSKCSDCRWMRAPDRREGCEPGSCPRGIRGPGTPSCSIGLLMGQIVQAEGIKVDRERVQNRLNDLVASYPNPDEVRRAYVQNADAMRKWNQWCWKTKSWTGSWTARALRTNL